MLIDVMKETGQTFYSEPSCHFDELYIRARSTWHRERYNQLLEAAKQTGLTTEQARVRAIGAMQTTMGESGVRRSAG